MKKIKLKKKEYIVIEKTELDNIIVDLWWRIKVSNSNAETIKCLKYKNNIDLHCNHSIDMLNQCEEILSKLNKEI